MSRSFIVAVALFCAASVATVLGCEDDEKVLVGEGGVCTSIVDCQAGLSCVASGDGRVCKTASTSVPVAPEEDGATPAEAGADTSTDPDTSTQDASTDDASDASDAKPATDAGDATIADASDAG